ncbi:MAG: sulfatase-like hydrolase/transferase [bacterium]
MKWLPKTQGFRALMGGIAIPSLLILVVVRLLRWSRLEWSAVVVDNLRVDLGFYAGALLIAAGAMFFSPRKPALIVTQIVFGLFLAIEAIAANFLASTGNFVDFPMIAFTLTHLGDTWDVMQSETPWWFIPTAMFGFLFFAVFPWVLWRKGTPNTNDTQVGGRAVGVGIVLMLTAFIPVTVSDSVAAARTPPVNVVASAVESALFGDVGANVGIVSNFTKAQLVPQTPNHPNIVILILESTRASGTTVYNPELKTTPFLAELAAKSVVAERAHTMIPHTSKALVTILCGFEPYLEMPIVEATKGLPGRCLPGLLNDVGYSTVFLQSATQKFESRAQLVARMEFKDFFPLEAIEDPQFGPVNYFGVEDEVLLKPMENWIAKQQDGKPFMMTVLTVGPHHNYAVPPGHELIPFAQDDEFNRYLNALHRQDNYVRETFAMFDRLGLTQNTVFVVLGDHGEGFGEHGRFQHDNVIYEEGLHVPLLIMDGRNPQPKRVTVGVSQLDVVPTLAAMSGFALQGADYVGSDITSLSDERLIPSHCWFSKNCMAAYLGGMKYIHHFENQPDEVYDLRNDPGETKNLKELAEHADTLEASLKAWRQTALARYQQYYGKMDAELMSEAEPPVQNKVDVLYENGLRLIGSTMTRTGDDVAVELVFHTGVPLPKGTANGIYVGPEDSRIYGVPDPTKAWVPMAAWPPEKYVLRHFLMKNAPVNEEVFLTMSYNKEPVNVAGDPSKRQGTPVGVTP